jgi:hypothetical protein
LESDYFTNFIKIEMREMGIPARNVQLEHFENELIIYINNLFTSDNNIYKGIVLLQYINNFFERMELQPYHMQVMSSGSHKKEIVKSIQISVDYDKCMLAIKNFFKID